ncbi:MAG: ABC transporter ATP-binding protein [bacterium]
MTTHTPQDTTASQIAPAPILSLTGLWKRFSGVDWVVRDFELSVGEGEILSILGPSGCGKTTLLRLIAGFEIPERGEIRNDGKVISRPGWVVPPEQRRIGMVFQEYTLFPHLTVRENVQFGLTPTLGARLRGWIGGKSKAPPENGEARKARKEGLVSLMALCGLTEMTERYPHELSGGQQQRVALARALVTAPRMLLMDEPFSNLDSNLRHHLREEVRAILKGAGTTSILVTHDQEEAINMGDRMAVMNQGRLEQVGTPLEVLQNPANRFVASFIGWNRFLPGRLENGKVVTELGEFPLPPPTPLPVASGQSATPAIRPVPTGGLVDVLLRPSQVAANLNGSGVPSQVLRVQYLSGQALVTLALPSGLEIQALLPESAPLRPGERTHVRFEPSPLIYFPSE